MVWKRGTASLKWDIVIYLVRLICCLTSPSIGKEFGFKNYSTLDGLVQRVNLCAESDMALKISSTSKKVGKGLNYWNKLKNGVKKATGSGCKHEQELLLVSGRIAQFINRSFTTELARR